MKTIVSKSDLQDAINCVMPAVAVKSSTPILGGVFFSAEKSGLTVRATNFQLDITAKIPATVETAGATVTTGKFLQPIVNKLSGEIVTLETGDTLTVKSEAASFSLLTMDADDFPNPAADQPVSTFRISGAALRNLINRTAFACGDDQTRPHFTGVHFNVDGTNIRAEGSNAHRIAIANDQTYDSANADIIVPATTLKAIAPALVRQVVTVDIFPRAVAFTFDNIHILSRLVDGSFPNTAKTIPESVATSATVDANELKAALERVRVIAKETDYKTVACIFTADGLEISSNQQNIGRVIEHVDADVSGADINIAFNFAYLLEGMKAAGGDRVKFGLNGELEPAALNNPDDATFLYIVTPLRTR